MPSDLSILIVLMCANGTVQYLRTWRAGGKRVRSRADDLMMRGRCCFIPSFPLWRQCLSISHNPLRYQNFPCTAPRLPIHLSSIEKLAVFMPCLLVFANRVKFCSDIAVEKISHSYLTLPNILLDLRTVSCVGSGSRASASRTEP